MTNTSDKSSGPKSISPLSTSSAGNRNPPIESIHLHSLPTEGTSAEFLSDAKQDQQIDEDNFSPQETPLVCPFIYYIYICKLAVHIPCMKGYWKENRPN